MTIQNLEVIRSDEEYKINNIMGFIEFIQIMSRKGYTWFRGQSVEYWDIEPGLSRTKISPQNASDSLDEISFIYFQTTDFNAAIDEAIAIVNTDSKYKKIKELNLTKLQFLFLAQHYGLITPVIDWTTNPNIALFFALEHSVDDPDFSPVLYATNPKLINYNSFYHVNEKSVDYIMSADKLEISDFMSTELKKIEGTSNKRNTFIMPVAFESELDFSHRITYQSGKFTVNGPKKIMENVRFKNLMVDDIDLKKDTTCKLNISAEINMDNTKLVSELKNYLTSFGYTKKSVYRLGDAKSELLDNLFKQIQEKHNNYPKNLEN